MLDHCHRDTIIIGQRGAELGVGDVFGIGLNGGIAAFHVGPAENDTCASRGRLQDELCLLAAMHTDTCTYCRPRDRLLKFYTTGQHTNLQFRSLVWGVCLQDTKHGLFRRITKRAKMPAFAL